ncbi:MAG: 23S rRNA (guanosine(2251)-2'-O)-methyltransferase RlmB [Candidatus Tectomicrobia bacterium]|uniref:23S rRNA (Guanosine(2251)-2'-O)-methyltransferase RlmB n=1 Tax=Tectimicrobiota bacterium TaxID=2528274 RepID=A0A933LQV3_UNCTE|nr:23S rRNA (guanosine(2251)-2'-O)-methyltransferase RlmB [Candidatus Tectomicrobia bacterium]
MTFIYGINSVREALVAQRRKIDRILIAQRKDQGISRQKQQIIENARELKIKVDFIAPGQISALVKTHDHQGVAAYLEEKSFVPLKKLIEQVVLLQKEGILLILDGIEDPRNLGAIIRSSVGFGVTGIIIGKDRAVHPTPVVAKAASGGMEYIDICEVTNISQTIQTLKRAGLWIWGLDSKGEKRIDEMAFEGPLGIVVGAEGAGIRPLVKKSCDGLLRIPMRKGISSFNVSIACSLVLYEFQRKYW